MSGDDPLVNRIAVFQIRLTLAEKEQLREAAKARGLSLSDFAREQMGLSTPAPPDPTPPRSRAELVAEAAQTTRALRERLEDGRSEDELEARTRELALTMPRSAARRQAQREMEERR